ncbi:hypothetical protein AXG93_1640s1000 [Marchantia polymorpha subsp. ruderalis]|uniref:Uncharacterized protein n=1 Tax=Marchantia polymorpha subsp. ruderalis TaxID=1480154 RepID=A0A176WCS4_MARPO|nr:hypothetical protein AXG93_1640s1000 [Marchantia polymorpha subsp. ruderalis]
MLAGRGVEAAPEEATRPSGRESPRILAAKEILESEEETPSEEEEDQKYRNLEERYNFLQDQWALTRKLQMAALKLQDEMVERVRRELNELRAKFHMDLSDKRVQIRNLIEELVRKTRALEESEATRRADEELLGRLQSQCEELRAQRAAAEVQLAEEEDHNRRAADRTREELVVRVDRCLRGYAHWEIATRKKSLSRSEQHTQLTKRTEITEIRIEKLN